MSKKLKADNTTIEQFRDIYEFMDAINSRPLNKAFCLTYDCQPNEKDKPESHTEEDQYGTFYGTRTYAEADHLFECGWNEGVTAIENALGDTLEGKGIHYKSDVVGFAPNIPNAIMGLPDSMISADKREVKHGEVTINYGIGALADVEASEIARAARLLLDTIAHYEQNGTKVNLVISKVTELHGRENKYIGIVMPVKRADQPLNLKLVAYPLSHPSFFRRHYFHWLETMPQYPFKKADYGYSIRKSKVLRSVLEKVELVRKTDLCITTYELMDMTDSKAVIDFFNNQNKALK